MLEQCQKPRLDQVAPRGPLQTESFSDSGLQWSVLPSLLDVLGALGMGPG